ncbi:MAG: BatA domain-containing protein, partial [Planctomycetia bacterium]|nr:BatA domain-containing protein [Planctomycetia bacterium]
MPIFVTPLMLLGTALVAVPILLHLLMQQQPRHLEFPALRFIVQRRDVNRRRLRLRHLLLLLLRAGAILLLAAALARPVFQSAGLLAGGDAPLAAALVFDTGPRMEYRNRNQTRLEAAQKLGRTLLAQLPADSDVVVLDGQTARADFDIERGMAGLKIDRLTISPATQPLLAEFDQALAVVRKSTRPRKEIHLFTDLSRAQWGGDQMAAWRKRLKENPDVAVYAIDVGVPDPQNFGLGQIDLSNQIV